MSCEVCTAAPGSVELRVPADHGLELQKLCTSCASGTGYFCTEHRAHHIIYGDDTSACPFCIHEGVQELVKKRTRFHVMLAASLTDPQWDELIAHIPYYPGSVDFEKVMAKMVITAAQRYRTPRQDVILRLVNDKDWQHIIVPQIVFVPAA